MSKLDQIRALREQASTQRQQRPMPPHHRAWLGAHPDRSAQWLAEKLADGFHIHHLDDDHSNNDPDNLVLVEKRDHGLLHGWCARQQAKAEAPKFNRLTYQREYMRKRRAALKKG